METKEIKLASDIEKLEIASKLFHESSDVANES